MSQGLANSGSNLKLGGGAQFWVYLSPQNNTPKVLTNWRVTFSQGNWSESITSEDPTKQIQTSGLSGIFDLKVEELNNSVHPPMWIPIPPLAPSTNQIGCNSNCASMVQLVALANPPMGGANAQFVTTWDALCTM